MVKLIGMILILSSLLSLTAATWIDLEHGIGSQITGKVISNIFSQPKVSIGFLDYAEAIAFSYSIVSFIMGVMFLTRV